MMRSLGYPNVISMEAFRTPNFELVAELLYWLVKRYDPDAMISDEIGTETERVRFLKAVGTLMHGKARVKLSLRRLYASDGLAVKEMLKIASILYQASAQTAQEDDEDSELDGFNLGPKSFDAKLTRQLASEITLSGAKIFDGLEREPELQVARNAAIHRNMDLDQIEAAVQEAIQQVKDNVVQVEQHTADMEKDKKNLEAKIEKRKAELDRSEKRLNTLQSVRPAYMDEYEKLQGKLQDLYVEYLEKFRNLEFLEDRLEARRQREQQARRVCIEVREGDRGRLRPGAPPEHTFRVGSPSRDRGGPAEDRRVDGGGGRHAARAALEELLQISVWSAADVEVLGIAD